PYKTIRVELMNNTPNSSSEPRWAGELLGLPESGAASMASYPRRVGAIFVDWFIASGIRMILEPDNQWVVRGMVCLMHFSLLWLSATPVAIRLFMMQVVESRGETTKPDQAVLRAALVCLVVPVLVVDRDARALPDTLTGAVEIPM